MLIEGMAKHVPDAIVPRNSLYHDVVDTKEAVERTTNQSRRPDCRDWEAMPALTATTFARAEGKAKLGATAINNTPTWVKER